MNEFLQWFAGGVDHAYMNLYLCMAGDTAWINTYIASGCYVFFSYAFVVIFFLWRYRKVRKTKFARAMLFGALVFFWCGISGYLMSGLVSSFWPAKRLETIMRYATGTINLAWVYHLYKISFIERILTIDAKTADHGSPANANAG